MTTKDLYSIRPLVFHLIEKGYWRAFTKVGTYTLDSDTNLWAVGIKFPSREGVFTLCCRKTYTQARAAAQAHYEERYKQGLKLEVER